MTRITEGHLARHYQGLRGGRDAALLDIAQDHALYVLHSSGLFDRGLVFKGGTALRKFRAGNAGRFSTDLDFVAPDDELALAALDALDGVDVDGFAFTIDNLGDDGRRGDLTVDTPFGRPQLGAKVELARHRLSLDPETLKPVRLPIHDRYDFTLQPTPIIRVEEAVSEKLARYRRVSLARDLYDLQWFATTGTLDEELTRRLWVLKVYRDVVVDGRGTKPVDPNDVLRPRDARDFRQEDIGYLTKPVRLDEWIATVRSRYGFITRLDADELRWLDCNERDRYEIDRALASFRAHDKTVDQAF
jgi:predicted nucleotidyltransferase component of viral defense system